MKVGDVLGGKYRVERLIGSGGMGLVVAARHVDLGKAVALKLMRSEAARDPDSVERFLREARAAVQLRGDHCVRVLDVGRLDDRTPYMVMELLAGRDLGAIVEQEGPRSVEDAVHFLLQACEGIAEAHARGIVHRDLKLPNMVLTRRPDGSPLVKVLDFGLAKTVSASPELRALTQSTAVMGSPMYMSPEQMRASRDVDARTDIWSLGVCLYELLTGQSPFDAATVPEVFSLVLTQPPSPLPPRVPPGLADVVSRCLQKRPGDRSRAVAELAAALQPFGPDPGAAARIRSVLEAPHEPVEPAWPARLADAAFDTRSASSFDAVTRPSARRSRARAAMIVGAAVVVAVAAITMQVRRSRHAAAASPAPMNPPAASAMVADVSPPPAPTATPAPPTSASAVTTASVSVPAPHRGPSSPARPRVGASHPASTAPVLAPKTTQF